MSADRGRLTHHPPRKYREVVSQQGRVLLDADSNEAQRIASEETRKEALDFVGPRGTPDDGYEVVPGSVDFQVTQGTMYVGGLRATLEAAVQYSKQSEWRDTTEAAPWAEGLWVNPSALLKGNFSVGLVLREQEISAVEDPALREVALGGPDTCARTRLIQRIVVTATKNNTCDTVAKEVDAFWSSKGLVHDRPTAELRSRARLQVTPVTTAAPASPCDPPSASGYLGADNQTIRVQVTAFDSKTNTGTLLWGYFNASTLYRCTVETASTVKLATRPVSAEYQPRMGQVVQILSRAADLGEGAFAAALTGHFAKLTTAYAPDTQIVTLPGALPQPPFANASNVYLRLWEDQATFTVGTAVPLAGTGLQVTLTPQGTGPLHLGDYWCIAVRPSTPAAVYPERLLTSPQPPDGPRMWTCALAVVTGGKTLSLAEDCRLPFDNLVELTARETGESCACTICVTPQAHSKNAPSLQAAIDQVIKAGGGVICLEVGQYPLKKPLRIQPGQSLRIVGKGDASQLRSELTAIEVIDSHDIAFESFSVQCRGNPKLPGSALLFQSSSQLRVEHVTMTVENAGWSAVGLSGAIDGVVIRDNAVTAPEGVINVVDPKKSGTGVVDLCVEDNRFSCAAIAIRLSNVSVLQQVCRIAGNRIIGCELAGVQLTGATVDGFGVEVVSNELRVAGHGIVAGINGLRVIDNDVIGPKASGTDQRGIVLTKGMAIDRVDDTLIEGNRISNFGIGIFTDVALGAVTIARNQIARATVGLLVQPVPVASLAISGNQMRDIVESAMHIESTEGRVAACGNQLQIMAGKVGVNILCRSGDCVYADNHSEHVKGGPDGVLLTANTIIATSNRVIGKVRMIVNPQGKKLPFCTVVGNITGSVIVIQGSPVVAPSPWDPINLQNV